MIRSKDGNLQRNVPRDQVLKEGDDVIIGAGELLKDFSYDVLTQQLQKAFAAMKKLRDHMNVAGFKWIERNEDELRTIASTRPQ